MGGELVRVSDVDIQKYLRPVESQQGIARLADDLAKNFFSAKHSEDGPIVRLSPIYFGRYGVLGYVEMNKEWNRGNRIEAWEIITVADSLWERLEGVKGLRGYLREAVFEDKDMKPESLDHPSLQGVPLLDTSYSWLLFDGGSAEWHELSDLIKKLEGRVIKRITEFDGYLDKLVPEDKRPNFASLNLEALSKPE